MKRVVVELSDVEYERLLQLSKRRCRTPVQCMQDFVRTCQPEGSGWTHPMKEKTAK